MVRTIVIGSRPPEIEALIAKRQQLGLDRHDEVWEGDYHMNFPGPSGPHAWIQSQLIVLLAPLARALGWYVSTETNVGVQGNFRVPDLMVHREMPLETWFPTAAVVVEVESPGDESRDKFGFYADHGVDEVLIVSPWQRTVEWFALVDDPAVASPAAGGRYAPASASRLLGPETDTAVMAGRIEWPPPGSEY